MLKMQESGVPQVYHNIIVSVSNSDHIVAVIYEGCTEGDVRLLEGSTRLQGRVEICKNNVWGTVCDYGWGKADATVVCWQLNLSVAGTLC